MIIHSSDQLINGAVFLIQMLLITKSIPAVQHLFSDILREVATEYERQQGNNLKQWILLLVYLAAIIHNENVVFTFLSEHDKENQIFTSILDMCS